MYHVFVELGGVCFDGIGREFVELELVVNYGCLKIVEVKSL